MIPQTPVILTLPEILRHLPQLDLVSAIEQGFVDLSFSKAVVPPVGELLFDDPPGETHIKYGYIKEQDYYVIKIASGFYDNPTLGISSSQGVMLLFSKHTGQLLAVLLDEGRLTDIRTVIAGIITIKHLAPKAIKAIGIIGTGTQAKLQLDYLPMVTACKNIVVWGRNPEKTNAFKEHFKDSDYQIQIANSIAELAEKCNVIITTTPATTPLLQASEIKKGTHITAIGSDTSEKIELDTAIIQKADIIISDSIAQSKTRGEIFRARQQQCLDETKLVELGNLIQNPALGRVNDKQITVADLTGVAVQDIMIATAVYNSYKNTTDEH